MLRLGAVVLQVSAIERAGAFWSEALAFDRAPWDPAFIVPQDTAPGTWHHAQHLYATASPSKLHKNGPSTIAASPSHVRSAVP